MNHISLDFETFYSKKLKYSIKLMIAEQYCRHELFHPYYLSVSDGSTSWSGEPKDFNWNALSGQTLVSHNRYFDSSVYSEMVRRGWAPKIDVKAWHCTADLTSYLCNRRALAQAVEFLYNVKLDKGTRSDSDNKHWPQDFPDEEQKRMQEYARHDAYWCWKLFADHGHKWPESERRLSDMTIRQGQHGVQINGDLLNDYIMWTHEMKMNTEKLLPWLSDEGDEEDEWIGFTTKPTSTKCIAEQCRRNGIPCPPVKSREGEEAFQEWEDQYGPLYPWIGALSSWRSVNKLYKTFLIVKERLRSDGTLPFALKYFGAHTGRWSGDARINFQNMRKRPVICTGRGLMESDDKRVDQAVACFDETGKYPDWVRYSIDFRKLIVPRPGKKMILSDLSQIEPRVLAWLAGNNELLDYVRKGMSIYEAHARTNMGYTGGPMDKKSMDYALAKAQVLALGYQAGWEKFIVMGYDYTKIDFTADDPEWEEIPDPITGELKKVSGYGKRAREIVATFRLQNSKTVGVWNNLDSSFKQSIGGDFVMALPSGRKMTYRGVRCETRIEKGEDGKPKRRSVFTAEVDGRRAQYYGGKLTENLVQATARDIFAEHLLRLEDSGVPILFSVHDEAVCEVDQSVMKEDVEHVMSFCPDWMEGCPIGAEAKEVPHYLK